MDWQPIETAPKDGTVILIGAHLGIDIGLWADWLNGWIDEAQSGYHDPNWPTHWMPLPNPPSA